MEFHGNFQHSQFGAAAYNATLGDFLPQLSGCSGRRYETNRLYIIVFQWK